MGVQATITIRVPNPSLVPAVAEGKLLVCCSLVEDFAALDCTLISDAVSAGVGGVAQRDIVVSFGPLFTSIHATSAEQQAALKDVARNMIMQRCAVPIAYETIVVA